MNRTSTQAATVPPSVVILGSDALLTALPATPTQLANACYAAGFEGVFPASWGDELVAAGCLKNLETRIGPAILCSCPLVSEQLRGVAPLQRFQLHLVSPPTAAARYLRALCDDAPLRITYVGDCPGADDASIDERVSPGEFLRRLSERGITPLAQRPDLGANVPRDRRRFYSLPGGAPTPEWLSADWPKRTLVDIGAGEALADLAHHALERESTLIDFAPQLGCACSGAVGGVAPAEARRGVAALEPPRARQEVLDPDLRIPVEAMVPMGPGGEEVTWDEFLASLPKTLSPEGATGEGDFRRNEPASPPRRRSREGPSGPRVSHQGPRVTRGRGAAAEGSGDREETAAEADPPATRPTAVPSLPVPSSALTSVRTTQPMPRRSAMVEGPSAPRYPAHARTGLTPSDRWVLLAAVIGGSAVSAIVASALTVRIMAGRAAAHAPTTSAPTTGGEVITPVKDSIVASERADSVITPVPQPVRPPVGDQRTLVLGAAAAQPPAPAPRKATPPAPRGTALLHRPAPRVIAPPAAPPSATVFSTAPAAPRVDSAVAASAPPPDTTAAAPVAVPVVVPVATPAAPPPEPVAAPPAAAAAAAAPQTDVAAELKAIRDELNARKKRVDSLTHSLDSLKTAPPPR